MTSGLDFVIWHNSAYVVNLQPAEIADSRLIVDLNDGVILNVQFVCCCSKSRQLTVSADSDFCSKHEQIYELDPTNGRFTIVSEDNAFFDNSKENSVIRIKSGYDREQRFQPDVGRNSYKAGDCLTAIRDLSAFVVDDSDCFASDGVDYSNLSGWISQAVVWSSKPTKVVDMCKVNIGEVVLVEAVAVLGFDWPLLGLKAEDLVIRLVDGRFVYGDFSESFMFFGTPSMSKPPDGFRFYQSGRNGFGVYDEFAVRYCGVLKWLSVKCGGFCAGDEIVARVGGHVSHYLRDGVVNNVCLIRSTIGNPWDLSIDRSHRIIRDLLSCFTPSAFRLKLRALRNIGVKGSVWHYFIACGDIIEICRVVRHKGGIDYHGRLMFSCGSFEVFYRDSAGVECSVIVEELSRSSHLRYSCDVSEFQNHCIFDFAVLGDFELVDVSLVGNNADESSLRPELGEAVTDKRCLLERIERLYRKKLREGSFNASFLFKNDFLIPDGLRGRRDPGYLKTVYNCDLFNVGNVPKDAECGRWWKCLIFFHLLNGRAPVVTVPSDVLLAVVPDQFSWRRDFSNIQESSTFNVFDRRKSLVLDGLFVYYMDMVLYISRELLVSGCVECV